MKVRAVLLDLDGTLINTSYSLQDTMNKTMEKFGCDPITLADTRKYIGNGYHKFVERALQATADRLYREAEKWEEKDEDRAFELDQQADDVMGYYDEACDYYIRLFHENCMFRNEAYPGMPESLAKLRENGIRIACVTNKSLGEAVRCLDKVFGEGVFDYVSADDGTHPLKPDPGVIFDAAEKLGVLPAECVFVGDTDNDILAGKRAGLRTVGCLYGFRDRAELENAGADVLIEEAGELADLVLGME